MKNKSVHELPLCFIYFETMLLGAYKFRSAISSWGVGALVTNYEVTVIGPSHDKPYNLSCLILTWLHQLSFGRHVRLLAFFDLQPFGILIC